MHCYDDVSFFLNILLFEFSCSFVLDAEICT